MSALDRLLARRRWLALLSAAAFSTSLGCQTPECVRCPDFAATAIPPPPGTYVCRWIRAQNDRAGEIDFVVHQHEWYQDGAKLGPQGRRHVEALAYRLPLTPYLVVIEPHEVQVRANEDIDAAIARSRELDQIRRRYVVESLAAAEVADANERVIIEYPRDEGLLGEETPRVYRQLLRSGTRGGSGGFGGGIGGGGFGGGGGSFGGGNAGGYF